MASNAMQGNHGNLGGSLGASNVAPVPPDTLQSIIASFDPLLNRLDAIVERAVGCGDRISGARPPSTCTAEKNPEPNHLIWAVQARRSRLSGIVDFLESEMGRIEQGL